MEKMGKLKREVLTADELAKILGLSVKTIYHAAKKDAVPALRVGRRWLFPKKAIYQWLRSGQKPKRNLEKEVAAQASGKLPLFE